MRGAPRVDPGAPVIFSINDISAVVRCKVLLYADDSALLVPGFNVKDIEHTIGIELESVNQWLVDNKLSAYRQD